MLGTVAERLMNAAEYGDAENGAYAEAAAWSECCFSSGTCAEAGARLADAITQWDVRQRDTSDLPSNVQSSE
jgi:hypothetical protein